MLSPFVPGTVRVRGVESLVLVSVFPASGDAASPPLLSILLSCFSRFNSVAIDMLPLPTSYGTSVCAQALNPACTRWFVGLLRSPLARWA